MEEGCRRRRTVGFLVREFTGGRYSLKAFSTATGARSRRRRPPRRMATLSRIRQRTASSARRSRATCCKTCSFRPRTRACGGGPRNRSARRRSRSNPGGRRDQDRRPCVRAWTMATCTCWSIPANRADPIGPAYAGVAALRHRTGENHRVQSGGQADHPGLSDAAAPVTRRREKWAGKEPAADRVPGMAAQRRATITASTGGAGDGLARLCGAVAGITEAGRLRRRFPRGGFGQWGRKMQTDLSDGVRALAAQGTIDQARVHVGASYGGYRRWPAPRWTRASIAARCRWRGCRT